MVMTYHFAILKNETKDDHREWVRACESSEHDIRYKVIDVFADNWLENAFGENYDCFLARPPRSVAYYKHLYDERLFIINRIFKKSIYPSYGELLIYENKRMLSLWLDTHDIPHPRTWIFGELDKALEFASQCALPVVAKTSIGASGSGVRMIRDRKGIQKYIARIFSDKGITRKWGPNLRRGELWKRFVRRLKNIPDAYRYFRDKRAAALSRQRGFAILQEYIPVKDEWRCVRICDSYFGHKKLRGRGEMFSGTSKVAWEKPPERLLNFVKDVCDKGDFLSQAVDIFETESGAYLVNELQCFFGSKNPHQMIIDGQPGRYILENGEWVFEQGNFNTNNSFDLRLKHVIKLLERGLL